MGKDKDKEKKKDKDKDKDKKDKKDKDKKDKDKDKEEKKREKEEKKRKKEEEKRKKKENKKKQSEYTYTKVEGQQQFFFDPYKVSSWNQSSNFDKSVLPINDFDIDKFQELRQHQSESSALAQLSEIGVDLANMDIGEFTMDISRVCFICCNTYTKPMYKLGVGPLNDSITVAANHKFMGYFIYFLHNPPAKKFLQYLQLFLAKTVEALTVYYTGHGSNITDRTGDEDDGKDEVMIFEDTYIIDDQLASILKSKANGKAKVVLLNDCCHSGSIWDIPDPVSAEIEWPANIICISAADDSETAKQGRQNNSDQGFFTFFFFQEVRRNRSITPTQAQNRVSSQLKNYHQCVVVSPTRPELLNQPIFPAR
ncbi:hypothetical protein M9Y10_036176 [Tritrichomonas musculus]|uniref:Chromatin assembly factor 1 p150 subunit acidic region domain-containing protein n=1 Tax=Tritrichomonas musculus TaxID=1915356 RepID=A0ABR2GUM7_9EUKA